MNKLRGLFLGLIVWIIYKIISFTWRVQIKESAEFKRLLAEKKTAVLAHFHGDEIALLYIIPRYRAATMSSTSKDGEIMNTLVHLQNGATSRGSSTRGAVSALKGLVRLAKSGRVCSVAVDGPKGPRHEVKPGVLELSRLINAPIFFGSAACDKAWHFPKSWNKTYFPKPFAQVTIVWEGSGFFVGPDQDPRDPLLAKALQNQLFNAQRSASKLIADDSSSH